MTKKDYELIAEAIKNAPIDILSRERVALSIAESLKKDNARFNQKKFIEWCEA